MKYLLVVLASLAVSACAVPASHTPPVFLEKDQAKLLVASGLTAYVGPPGCLSCASATDWSLSLRRYRHHGGAGACGSETPPRKPRCDERRRRAEHDRPERGRFRCK